MNTELLQQKARGIIIDTLGIYADKCTGDATLKGDLNADSLDILELILELEKEFNVRIADTEIEKIKTVDDLLSYIAENAPADYYLKPSGVKATEPSTMTINTKYNMGDTIAYMHDGIKTSAEIAQITIIVRNLTDEDRKETQETRISYGANHGGNLVFVSEADVLDVKTDKKQSVE